MQNEYKQIFFFFGVYVYVCTSFIKSRQIEETVRMELPGHSSAKIEQDYHASFLSNYLAKSIRI